MLIHVDSEDCCHNPWRVEAEDGKADDDARLVAKHRPAEMDVGIERQEAADAGADENKSDGHGQPHPRLDRAQVRVLVRVEVLEALDGLTHLDVPHARV